MFRRITVLASALALFVAGALSWTAAAAPITGSFTVDITFIPQQLCEFELIDTPLLVMGKTTRLRSSAPPSDPIRKIDRILVKFEADLLLTMSISGLELTSSYARSPSRAWRSQLFFGQRHRGRDGLRAPSLVFAPNIIEFEDRPRRQRHPLLLSQSDRTRQL
jgi:hypothetical protein